MNTIEYQNFLGGTILLNSHSFNPDYGEKTKKIIFMNFGLSPKKKSLPPENAFTFLC
jgi:hypothetical protein